MAVTNPSTPSTGNCTPPRQVDGRMLQQAYPSTRQSEHDAYMTKIERLALWPAIGIFLLLAHRVFVYTPDDAYITYRYAVNLAEGYGPVFNRNAPASDRTEGYSCPLFMFLMAALWKLPLGVDLVIKAKLLGICCGIALLFLSPRLAALLGMPAWARVALPVLVATHAVFVVSSVDGMETILATLWTTWATCRFLQEWQSQDAGLPVFPWSGLLFAACSLTRPEGVLMGLAALSILLIGRRGRIGRYGILWIGLFLLPVIAWWVFRLLYYGSLMPNTYYAKNVPLHLAAEKGLPYLLRTFFRFVNESLVYAAIGGLWWLLVALGVWRMPFRTVPGIILPLCVGAQMLFAARTGGDWMSSWRYMAPVLVLLVLLSLAGIAEIGDAIGKTPRTATLIAIPFCIALLGVSLWGHKDYHDRPYIGYIAWAEKRFAVRDRELLSGWMLNKAVVLSDWLNAHLPPGSEIAYSEMGVTPHLSPQLRFLDVRGLTDRGIARLPGTRHEQVGVTDEYINASTPVGAYLKNERRPDYILWGLRFEGDQIPSDFTIALDRVRTQDVLDGAYECIAAFENPPAPPGCRDVIGVYRRR
ncbi:MAG: hypothetical protein RMJ43_12815 [Chloroherpetonaceae bacterium]|nr:hypothetical protein [Chthonomonadaceae bacterium]MDW8208711.1 hypothetical protein [Chloroherpetonaceae bacterium]